MHKDKDISGGSGRTGVADSKLGAGTSSTIGGGKPGSGQQDLGDAKNAESTDSRGTPTQRTPGPGPNDDDAGLMGEEAKSRLDRRQDDPNTKT